MTGRRVEYVFPPRPETDAREDARRGARGSRGSRCPAGSPTCRSSVRAGEIVGLAGLVGSGRSEILETMYGARAPTAGRVTLDGRTVRAGSVPPAVRAGMGLAPEERKSQALLLHDTVAGNITRRVARAATRALGWLDRRRELGDARRAGRGARHPPTTTRAGRYGRCRAATSRRRVLARWLLKGCRLLLLDEPTRGVDVGARAELYALVRRLADTGSGILLVSSEVPEVLGLADRVLVVRDGRVVSEAPAGTSTNPGCWTSSWKGAPSMRRPADEHVRGSTAGRDAARRRASRVEPAAAAPAACWRSGVALGELRNLGLVGVLAVLDPGRRADQAGRSSSTSDNVVDAS